MAVIPVARILYDLGADSAPVGKELENGLASRRCAGCRVDNEVYAEIEEARTQGISEGFERGRLEQKQSDQQLQDRLVNEQDARLAALAREARDRIDTGLERMRAEISESVARTLVSFFKREIELETMEALSNECRHILTEQGAARVTIQGPQFWIDQLIALPEFASASGKIEVQASETIDLTVNIDGTLLMTTIGDWLTGLRRDL